MDLAQALEAALKAAGSKPGIPPHESETRLRGLLSSALTAFKDAGGVASHASCRHLRRVVYELVKHAVEGNVATSRVAKLLTESTPPFTDAAASSIVADACWLIGVEFEEGVDGESGAGGAAAGGADWKKSTKFARFRAVVTDALGAKLVSDTVLKERLELDMLEACGLVKCAATFKKSIVRINTRNKFLQHKYNLLKEETEGYAKLVTELCRPLTPDSVAVTIRNMRTLIGYFRLDPNRVLDLVLEAFELVRVPVNGSVGCW